MPDPVTAPTPDDLARVWTAAAPTVPGWYWFRTGDSSPAVVRVWRDPKAAGLYVVSGNGKWPMDEWLAMADDDSAWAGPLVPPAKPEAG